LAGENEVTTCRVIISTTSLGGLWLPYYILNVFSDHPHHYTLYPVTSHK